MTKIAIKAKIESAPYPIKSDEAKLVLDTTHLPYPLIVSSGRNGIGSAYGTIRRPRKAAAAYLTAHNQDVLLRCLRDNRDANINERLDIKIGDDIVALVFHMPVSGDFAITVSRPDFDTIIPYLSVRLLDDGTAIGAPVAFGNDDNVVSATIHGKTADIESFDFVKQFNDDDIHIVNAKGVPRAVLENMRLAIDFALEHMD